MIDSAEMVQMRRIRPAILYFALVISTGFVMGTIRVPFLVPRLGERNAELLEMPFMFVAIVLAARYIHRRYDLPTSQPFLLQVGFIALAMSLLIELLLATMLQDRSLVEFVKSRDPVSGTAYLVMLLIFALMPAIIGRIKANKKPAP